jgi:hypothetical protein
VSAEDTMPAQRNPAFIQLEAIMPNNSARRSLEIYAELGELRIRNWKFRVCGVWSEERYALMEFWTLLGLRFFG